MHIYIYIYIHTYIYIYIYIYIYGDIKHPIGDNPNNTNNHSYIFGPNTPIKIGKEQFFNGKSLI